MWEKARENKMIQFLRKMIRRYSGHNVSATSAYMAYYWVLAFFPFIIFLISLLSYTKIPIGVLLLYISEIVPDSLVPVIEDTIKQFILYRSTALVSVGGLVTLWSAGTAVNALTRGIHMAYNSKYIKPFWQARVIALVYTVLLAVLLIVLMVGLVFGNRLGDYLFGILDMNKGIFMPIWNITRLIMPFIALIVVLYIIYKFIPRKYLRDASVWPGVIFTSLGWYTFSLIFSIYVDNYSKYNQLYGSIGSVFILLIWLYGSCTLLVLGAEINAQIQEMRIDKIVRKMGPEL